MNPNAAYWVKNVREPVQFQQAIEHVFTHDTPPELVVEIGPHRTLVSPIMETLSSMNKTAMVIPTLKRGGPCVKNVLEAVGLIYEKGMPVGLGDYYDDTTSSHNGRHYNFDEHLPKHPLICKPLWSTKQVLKRDGQNGINHLGPIGGQVSNTPIRYRYSSSSSSALLLTAMPHPRLAPSLS